MMMEWEPNVVLMTIDDSIPDNKWKLTRLSDPMSLKQDIKIKYAYSMTLKTPV